MYLPPTIRQRFPKRCGLVDELNQQLHDIAAKLDAILALLVNGELPQKKLPQPRPKARVTVVDDAFCAAMQEEFGDFLGGPEEVLHQIELAVGHKTHTKYHGKQAHVRNWLKNNVEYRQKNNNVPASNSRDMYLEDYERRRSQDELF